MSKVNFARIDNRLVHGQVGVVWLSATNSNLIVVCDDDAAKDPIQQQLMSVTAGTAGVGIRFFTAEKAINTLHKASPSQKVFLVCKTPAVFRKLVEGGVELEELNIGNMHFSEGKRQISNKVFVDDKDVEDLKFLKEKIGDVYIRDVPSDKKVDILDALK